MKPNTKKIIGITLVLILLLNAAFLSLVLFNISARKEQETPPPVNTTVIATTTAVPEISDVTIVKTAIGRLHFSFPEDREYNLLLKDVKWVAIETRPDISEVNKTVPDLPHKPYTEFVDTFFSTPLYLNEITKDKAHRVEYKYIFTNHSYIFYFVLDGRVILEDRFQGKYYVSTDKRFQTELLSQIFDDYLTIP